MEGLSAVAGGGAPAAPAREYHLFVSSYDWKHGDKFSLSFLRMFPHSTKVAQFAFQD